jgi:MarR-like DNA-binding transcriptional regulator SgrR of sgrS sRNA
LACSDNTGLLTQVKEDAEDEMAVVPSAVRCVCTLLEVTWQHGCLHKLLASLLEPEAEVTSTALGVRELLPPCPSLTASGHERPAARASCSVQHLPLLVLIYLLLSGDQGSCLRICDGLDVC